MPSISYAMPDGDLFDNSLHWKWRKVSRAYVGRQPFDHKVACISEAIRNCVSMGSTAKAVGAAVTVLETTLKNQQQGVLEFDHSPESPLHSFESRLKGALAECGGGKMVALVKEVSASVFVQCKDTYILEGAVAKLFAEEFTRRLVAGQCLDKESVKEKLVEAGITTGGTLDAWFETEFGALYEQLRGQMETFVASHGAKTPKKLVPVSAEAVNSAGYLTQPLDVLPLPDESVK